MADAGGAPSTGGAGSTSQQPNGQQASTKPAGFVRTRWARLQNTRLGRGARFTYSYRRPLLFGLGLSLFAGRYYLIQQQVKKRDTVHDDTILVWRMYDGGIVEYPSSQASLGRLLGESDSTEPPRVMSLYDALKTLRRISVDPRIKGIFADFSSTNAPHVPDPTPLGLSQIEELLDALGEVKEAKRATGEAFRTVAFAESFGSHGEYLLATGFDEIYIQPTGGVPLVGFSSTIPFYARLLDWFGIKVHAEARNEYKSAVAPYVQEQLTEAQAANQEELMNDLNDQMLNIIAVQRFPSEFTDDSPATAQKVTEKVRQLTLRGPLNAPEAVASGLVTGTAYKAELLENVLGVPRVTDEQGQDEDLEDRVDRLKEASEKRMRGFYHYYKINEKEFEKAKKKEVLNVGVVYVLGTIGDVGEFGTAAIVRGLREAADDDEIGAVVLRVDTGGGGVLESDTIAGAVKDLQSRGKIVVASFGNVAASGGYFIAAGAEAIFATPSTITGSIGVAGLRPTVTQAFFDKFKLTIQSFFTGSKASSLVHPLEGEDLVRHSRHIDETYEDFKDRVCKGRGISKDIVDLVAGGRVFTGLKAWELLYPQEEQEKLRLEQEKQVEEAVKKAKESVDGQGDAGEEGTVELDEDQATSPFAIPAPPTPAASTSTSATEDASSSQEVTIYADGRAPGTAAFGRGLIDGIGGIRDAAVFAIETYLGALVEQERKRSPDKTRLEVLKELMPDIDFAALVPQGEGEEGEAGDVVILPMDLRLKKFPVPRTFWQQLRENSARGDALDTNATFGSTSASGSSWTSRWSFLTTFFSPDFFKYALASVLARSAASLVDAEVDALGLQELRRAMRRTARTTSRTEVNRGRGMRAELWMPGLDLR